MDKATSFHVGKIVNTHGVRGEVKAIYYTDSVDFFQKISRLTLEPGGEVLTLKGSKAHKGSVILSFKGKENINEVLGFVGKEIYAQRDEAGEPEEGRYYIVDIIGLSVYTEERKLIGTIIDVFSTGSNDVYETRDSLGRRVLIPAISDVVLSIDIEKGEMVIRPLEGMIDHEI